MPMSDACPFEPYRNAVLAKIGPVSNSLLVEIEGRTNKRIIFAPVSMARSPLTVAACNPDHTGSMLFVPDVNNPTDQEISHELLHIKRYWIYGVRQLDPVRDQGQNRDIANSIENMVEHAWIYPEQARLGIDLHEQMASEVQKFQDRQPVSAFDAKLKAISASLMVHSGCLNDHQVAAAKARLEEIQQSSMLAFARRCHRLMPKRKEEAVHAIIDQMGIPRSELQWLRFDIFEGRKFVKRLPLR